MKLVLDRIHNTEESTIGLLHVDGEFMGFTLENPHHDVKIPGDTCIPEGVYELKLRNEGGMTKRYADKYSFHEGMLWLQNVENFEWVYIHVGNFVHQTEGCILIGSGCTTSDDVQTVTRSVYQYTKLYKQLLKAIHAGESVTIDIL